MGLSKVKDGPVFYLKIKKPLTNQKKGGKINISIIFQKENKNEKISNRIVIFGMYADGGCGLNRVR